MYNNIPPSQAETGLPLSRKAAPQRRAEGNGGRETLGTPVLLFDTPEGRGDWGTGEKTNSSLLVHLLKQHHSLTRRRSVTASSRR